MEGVQISLGSKLKLIDSLSLIQMQEDRNKVISLSCLSSSGKVNNEVVWRGKIQTMYYQLDSLEYLSARCYNLGTTDFDFSHFKKLRMLRLDSDSLVEIPKNVQHCNSLEILKISSNSLEKLPTWLFSMKSLKVLVVLENDTSKKLLLPKVKSENLIIEAIDLHKTNLSVIPLGFFNFPNLKYLNLSDTGLKEFPEGIKDLKNLEYLNLDGL